MTVALVPATDLIAGEGAPSDEVLPHAQTEPPGPPKSPQAARDLFSVPDDFHVQLVAAEPDVVNPIAMTWDDRGRIWVCESVQYPDYKPQRGKDRIRIHEDTDNDGTTDRVSTFVDDLSIPSGIAIGYGGIFVANAPDLLFFTDTDGDDRPDTRETLITGFGTKDSHELPNNLTWGPDGWLYGLNGVFNPSRIEHQGKVFEFTCALWRYHPVTRAFELFAEGTSNPYGLDYNRAGHWFVSACVIDHLWHLTQTGYYHRQSGAYPPNVWILGSIVDHLHQKRAYCGLAIYDADVYPAKYRGRILMGNIHGNCINHDRLTRKGATYFAEAEADFLSANDVWFMPVSQKVGPDGSIWVLDWYDRYHCYQDANRDPDGIDRLHGRLWRVRYGQTPMPEPFDLTTFSNERLVELLSHPNIWWRRKAQRLLIERKPLDTVETLQQLALSTDPKVAANNGQLTALWTLIGFGPLDPEFHVTVLQHPDQRFRAWGIRAAAEMRDVSPPIFTKIRELTADPEPDVRLQVAIASSRIEHPDAFALLLDVMAHTDDDPLIPAIVWQNLFPRADDIGGDVARWLVGHSIDRLPIARAVAERFVDLVAPRGEHSGDAFNMILSQGLSKPSHAPLALRCLEAWWNALRAGEIKGDGQRLFADVGFDIIDSLRAAKGDLGLPATALLTVWKDEQATTRSREIAMDPSQPAAERERALEALALAGDGTLPELVTGRLDSSDEPVEWKQAAMRALSRHGAPAGGELIVHAWPRLPANTQALAIDLLAGRPAWATILMDAVEREDIPKQHVNANQLRTMVGHQDEDLTTRLTATWGRVREERDPEREKVIEKMRRVMNRGKGNAADGQRIFKQVCAQCHTIYGHGNDIGPDITSNGRASLEQILSNLLDPNLVIGEGYVPRTVWTWDGEVLNGLVVEDSPQRIELKLPGGEHRVIARDDIEDLRVSKISLMPEKLENGLTDQEFRDLISFLLTTEAPVPWSQVPDVEPVTY